MAEKDVVKMNDSKTQEVWLHKEENSGQTSEDAFKDRKSRKSFRYIFLIQRHNPSYVIIN